MVKEVKKSDYIRGFNTSVSHTQLKELENIRDRLDGKAQSDTSKDSDIFKAVQNATQEIEEVLTEHGNSFSINQIIDLVKKKFHDVYIENYTERDYYTKTPIQGNFAEKLKETGELDGIKGKLDFQNAMDDLTKNYEWLKKKSLEALDELEGKHKQIEIDLDELNKRIENYNIDEIQDQQTNKPAQLSNEEKELVNFVLSDIFSFIGYTTNSTSAALENSLEHTNVLKEAIIEYSGLLEDKIKALPKIISSSNLKSSNKQRDVLYELVTGDANKSESSQYDSNIENDVTKEIQNLKTEVDHWKNEHKSLFDKVHKNLKLYRKMMNSKEMGEHSRDEMKRLFSKSNQKLTEYVKKIYMVYYPSSQKNKIRKERSHNLLSSSSKNLRSFHKERRDSRSNDNLLLKIDSLTKELNELKTEKEINEESLRDYSSLKTKHNLLKSEYGQLKSTIDSLETENDNKENMVNSLTRENKKLVNKVTHLQNEMKELETTLSQNKDNEYENMREYKNVMNRAKKN